jgi:hypothetical protein
MGIWSWYRTIFERGRNDSIPTEFDIMLAHIIPRVSRSYVYNIRTSGQRYLGTGPYSRRFGNLEHKSFRGACLTSY